MEFPPDVKIVYIMASITIFSDIKYSISELEICDITLDKLITKHKLYVSKLIFVCKSKNYDELSLSK